MGMVGAFSFIVWAIVRQDQLEMFTGDWFSPLFVLCGTVLGVMIRYSLGHFISSLKVGCARFLESDRRSSATDRRDCQLGNSES
jgi:hypothetical protein